jgi:SsrA-binding protein
MKVFAQSKKAGFNYEILEKFEAGMVLNGQEVKSIKTRGLSLDGTYVVVKPDGVFWVGGIIPPYQPGNAPLDWRNERSRQLLLRKSELKYLIGKAQTRGLTFVPLRLYTKERYEGSGKIKLEFGVARGKKKFDKRESIKKREVNREIARTFKDFNN